MIRFALSAIALMALATPVLAQSHHRHRPRTVHAPRADTRGTAIIVGNDDIRVNAAGEVMATHPTFVHVQKMEPPKNTPAK